jgi:hypothetical protein
LLFTVSHAAIISSHSAWLEPSGGDAYDAFLSYRWGEEDAVCQGIFAGMGAYNVTPALRPVVVFKDKVRLQLGMDFLRGFCDSLLASPVVVPLVSYGALQRMKTHNPGAADYTLMEWLLAIAHFDSQPHTHRVFPIMLGKVVDPDTGRREALDTAEFDTFPGTHY